MEFYPLKKTPEKLEYWINSKELFPQVSFYKKAPVKKYSQNQYNVHGCIIMLYIFLVLIAIVLVNDYTLVISTIAIVFYFLFQVVIKIYNKNKTTAENKVLEEQYNVEMRKHRANVNALKTLWK